MLKIVLCFSYLLVFQGCQALLSCLEDPPQILQLTLVHPKESPKHNENTFEEKDKSFLRILFISLFPL